MELLLLLYPVPWLVAAYRGHNNEILIFIVNLFAGWTIIGWVFALVWAYSDNIRK